MFVKVLCSLPCDPSFGQNGKIVFKLGEDGLKSVETTKLVLYHRNRDDIDCGYVSLTVFRNKQT